MLPQRHEEARSADNRAGAFLASHGLTAEAETRHSRPDEAIVPTAVDKQAGLIVVGSHGRTGLTRAMLGSVSERVIDTTSVPVLVAKATTRYPAGTD